MSEEAGILKSKPSLKNTFPHVEHKRSQLQGDENLFFSIQRIHITKTSISISNSFYNTHNGKAVNQPPT